MAATASTMILSALRMIGEKSPGGTLSSAEQTDYLYDLNAAMEMWSLDNLLIYHLLDGTKALTSGVGSYTIGSGGDINAVRPNEIVDPCFCRDVNGNDWPLEIIDAQRYGAIATKSTQGTNPEVLFYDRAYSTARGTIKLYPLPGAGLTLHYAYSEVLQSFALIGDTVALPPGYQLFIESNFAVIKAGGFTRVSPEIAALAKQSMALIKKNNLRPSVLQLPSGVSGRRRFNIYTGA